jgi:cytidine deaminase
LTSTTSALQTCFLSALVQAAKDASLRASAPYSKFPVGAAVLTDTGEIFSACNVENASYGLTVCAERNAVFRAVANGHRDIRAVVVFTPTDKPTAPCGACRQVINEFGPEAEVVAVCNTQDKLADTSSALLPKGLIKASSESLSSASMYSSLCRDEPAIIRFRTFFRAVGGNS